MANAALGKVPAIAPAALHSDVERPPHVPTGGGTPARQDDASASVDARTGRLHALPAPKRTRGVRASKPPNTRTANAEAKARNVWRAGMSVADLAKAARLSSSSASKWRKVLSAEDAQQDLQEEVAL